MWGNLDSYLFNLDLSQFSYFCYIYVSQNKLAGERLHFEISKLAITWHYEDGSIEVYIVGVDLFSLTPNLS